PFYPLLILLLHFLIALRLLPISDTNSLLLFIFFSVTLFLLHDRLVLLIARPGTKLEFLRQRWIAMNTQLAGVLVAGGFLIVPQDGVWTDARCWLVGFGVGSMIGFLIYVNASECPETSSPSKKVAKRAHTPFPPSFFHPRTGHSEEIASLIGLNSQTTLEVPVIPDLAEEGVENEVLFDGEARELEDLEAQLVKSK
ncbi:hypothetical protein BDY24DRAFT_405298, partial [Mrakia frigida]|uniref:uncharacterized protein n=1 Tax=Mrakia frigida TaxID=29902 RepID=UPI003FCC265E